MKFKKVIETDQNDKLKKSNLYKEDTDSDSTKNFGKYTPNAGFKLIETEKGDVSLSIFSYIRYLNQNGLDTSYTDSFGNTSLIRDRNDIQVNKVNIKFLGWFMDPKFRYLFYVWTSNTALGQSSQVVHTLLFAGYFPGETTKVTSLYGYRWTTV